jgi:hypothetical protein
LEKTTEILGQKQKELGKTKIVAQNRNLWRKTSD